VSNILQTNTLPKTLWHYTKMDVLEKIFPPEKDQKKYIKGKIILRFTNSRYSNDPSESMVLWKLLQENKKYVIEKCNWSEENFNEYINESKKRFVDTYIFSMSCLKDSFAFWSKEYAGTDGIAIEFKKKEFKEIIENIEYKIERQPAIFDKICYVDYNEPIKNIYENATSRYDGSEKQKIIEIIKKIIEDTSKHNLESDALKYLINYYSSIFKFTSWKHEEEVRIILRDFDKEIATSKKKHKDENLNADIAFVKGKIAKVSDKYFDKNIVKSIMLGPDYGEEHIEAVEKYLEKNKYDGIRVSKSKAFDLRYSNHTLA